MLDGWTWRVAQLGDLFGNAQLWLFAFGFAAAVTVITIRDAMRARPSEAGGARTGISWARAGTGSSTEQPSELRQALGASRSAFLAVAIFSGVINVLMLTGSFYMLEIYDRILPSRSMATLVALSVLVAGLYLVQAGVDLIRARILTRIGASLDEALGPRVFASFVRLPLRTSRRGDGLQPARDLDTVRQFLSGLGPTALFDLPWMPLYLAVIYAFHPILGYAALGGAVILVALTLLTEALTRSPAREAGVAAADRNRLGEASVRNAEVLVAMGLIERMGVRWRQTGRGYIASQQQVSDVASGLGALSKVLRMMLQSGMLALGAYLVIINEATAGVIIAGSILTSRALAPVELAIAHWRGFIAARQSWARLERLLKLLPAQPSPLALPDPSASLAVEGVSVAAPGEQRLIVQDASFALKAGQGLGIIGPSASGKSSLVRAVVGVWMPVRGKVTLDGAALDQWECPALGCHIGYLPQDVELFAGTVAENIARFAPDAEPEAVIAAAKATGVHDMIVSLKDGYETEIGEQGTILSAGQRQRIALARALYGEPFLVVLDEPNSNLDAEGEAALTRAIHGVREHGGIAVVVAHRPSALVALDMVLAIAGGRVQAFGPKDEVLGKVLGTGTTPHVPLKVVQEAGRAES